MTDRPQFKLHMAARDYVITWGEFGEFLCDDASAQEYVENLFYLYEGGYSHSATHKVVDFVDSIDAVWINKPKVPPIEYDESKIF